MNLMSPQLRRFYFVTTALTIVISTLAAVVNCLVGPVNFGLWIVPVVMLVFATISYVLLDAAVQQAENPNVVPQSFRRVFGKRATYFLRWANGWLSKLTSHFLLTAIPVFLLVFAILLLYFSITGEINSSGGGVWGSLPCP
jgi:hypothetical protein